ncbi:hypothetical protein [Actinoplanes sp. URMC 104]|uniref:hypothetical protein n=1 Tax=Actinoplanes sp. URMC 104 TaxID=3423409 RepID=UPI003F1D4821
MLKTILRTLTGRGVPDRDTKATRTFYGWRCPCGGHDRGGFGFRSDAEYAAQRHQWKKGIGHPMPEIHSFEEDIE